MSQLPFTSKSHSQNFHHTDIVQGFRQALHANGIQLYGEIIADGQLHRGHIEGQKSGSKNLAYVVHTDGCPAGWFHDFKNGVSGTWRSDHKNAKHSYVSQKERNRAKQRLETNQRKKNEAAANKARHIWDKTYPISNLEQHPYLVRKRINPYGAHLYYESLVIPIFDESLRVINLQFITPNGEKRFLSGAKKKGCFYAIGDPSNKILICEGYATAASLFEKSGCYTVIAFDAGNLLPVANVIRAQYPNYEIIVCGDNDINNVGQDKARAAALAIDGKILIPPTPGQDWNDYLTGRIK